MNVDSREHVDVPRVQQIEHAAPSCPPPPPLEKILAPHEPLRGDWPVEGTTGYEVGAQLTRTLMPAQAEPLVTAAYEAFVGAVDDPREEAYRCKLRLMPRATRCPNRRW